MASLPIIMNNIFYFYHQDSPNPPNHNLDHVIDGGT